MFCCAMMGFRPIVPTRCAQLILIVVLGIDDSFDGQFQIKMTGRLQRRIVLYNFEFY